MLITVSLRNLTLLCLILSSEGSDPLVALESSLDLIWSNMCVVLREKFKIKNRYEKLEIFHRRFCLNVRCFGGESVEISLEVLVSTFQFLI